MEIEHEIIECDIRRSIMDFGRCFISGFIAVFSFRKSRSATEAHRLSTFLLSFANCSHEVGQVCLLCAAELHKLSSSVEGTVPAVAKLSQSISEGVLMGSSSPLRPLSKAMYFLLGKAIQVR